MRGRCFLWLLPAIVGCGGGEVVVRPAVTARVAAPLTAASETRIPEPAPEMQTHGLTGSLSTVEVQRALEPRAAALGRCFADHGGRLRTLGGRIELAFHVAPDGTVESVHAVDSTVGHRAVERCIVEVARETRFPRPHGGAADFSWPLELDPPDDVRHPETWDPSRVGPVVRRRGRAVLERCAHDHPGPFQVTTYVSRSGRVLAAGAIALEPLPDEPLDCVAGQVRLWRMPRGRRQAKVTFELR